MSCACSSLSDGVIGKFELHFFPSNCYDWKEIIPLDGRGFVVKM